MRETLLHELLQGVGEFRGVVADFEPMLLQRAISLRHASCNKWPFSGGELLQIFPELLHTLAISVASGEVTGTTGIDGHRRLRPGNRVRETWRRHHRTSGNGVGEDRS